MWSEYSPGILNSRQSQFFFFKDFTNNGNSSKSESIFAVRIHDQVSKTRGKVFCFCRHHNRGSKSQSIFVVRYTSRYQRLRSKSFAFTNITKHANGGESKICIYFFFNIKFSVALIVISQLVNLGESKNQCFCLSHKIQHSFYYHFKTCKCWRIEQYSTFFLH